MLAPTGLLRAGTAPAPVDARWAGTWRIIETCPPACRMMPFFNENPLQQLAFQPGDADAVVDLRGMLHEQAMQRVERLLDDPGVPKTYLLQFDAASSDGRETLFLPLGRRLLQARRDGVLTRCLPIADGNAYFIAFASEPINSGS